MQFGMGNSRLGRARQGECLICHFPDDDDDDDDDGNNSISPENGSWGPVLARAPGLPPGLPPETRTDDDDNVAPSPVSSPLDLQRSTAQQEQQEQQRDKRLSHSHFPESEKRTGIGMKTLVSERTTSDDATHCRRISRPQMQCLAYFLPAAEVRRSITNAFISSSMICHVKKCAQRAQIQKQIGYWG